MPDLDGVYAVPVRVAGAALEQVVDLGAGGPRGLGSVGRGPDHGLRVLECLHVVSLLVVGNEVELRDDFGCAALVDGDRGVGVRCGGGCECTDWGCDQQSYGTQECRIESHGV